MRFQPKSEKQIQEERFPVLKPGKYHFEVIDAKDDVSKKGNEMIVLKLKVLDGSLNPLGYVTDYLMESISHKLRHACFACGLIDCYDTGELHADLFIGKSGMVDLVIQKDKSGQYPDKNSVQDYVIELHQPSGSAKTSHGDWGNDMPEPPEWVK